MHTLLPLVLLRTTVVVFFPQGLKADIFLRQVSYYKIVVLQGGGHGRSDPCETGCVTITTNTDEMPELRLIKKGRQHCNEQRLLLASCKANVIWLGDATGLLVSSLQWKTYAIILAERVTEQNKQSHCLSGEFDNEVVCFALFRTVSFHILC